MRHICKYGGVTSAERKDNHTDRACSPQIKQALKNEHVVYLKHKALKISDRFSCT